MGTAHRAHDHAAMSTILVRCSVHPQLSHEAFSGWLEQRCRELSGDPGGVNHVRAGRLGPDEWVIELRGPRRDDDEFESAARHFVADLSLLGMRPAVFVATPDALVSAATWTQPVG